MTEREIEEIKSRYAEILRPAKHNTFICDICGSGSGKNGTGLTVGTKNKTHLTCWNGGCSFSEGGDIISYYMKLHNLDFPTACKELADIMHITLEQENSHRRTTKPNKAPLTAQTSNYTPIAKTAVESRTEPEKVQEDKTEFFRKCNAALNVPNNKGLIYITGRGISLETCNKFNIGYCCDYKPEPKGRTPEEMEHIPATERIILPNNQYCYTARAIDPNAKIKKQKGGEGHSIFNNEILFSSDHNTIFVVEGEIDAMSIYEAGASAIGLGSTKLINRFLELIDQEPAAKEKTFIICGDNDESGAGEAAAEKLFTALKERNIDCIKANINGIYKDANEHLQNNRAEFIKQVRAASDPFKCDLMSNNIDKLLNTFSRPESKAISTGFKQLDEQLSGGLHKGELTLIGAAPSLGKTTLAMQIIENIAQSTDEEILCFSLEMSKAQHFSKSLSRLTWETNPKICDPKQDFFLLQAGEIINNTIRLQELQEPLERALKQYRTYADRLHIFDQDRNIKFVSDTVERFIHKTGKTPIVVIDYVQLLKTDNNKAAAIDVIQETISVLSRLKAAYNIAIVAIVAFNRDSYKDFRKVNLDSGRDTSDLEYSADTYIALNFTEWENDSLKDTEKHGREELLKQQPRLMTAKILKKRMGEPYGKIKFIYRSHINHFEELQGNIRGLTEADLTPDNLKEPERLIKDIARLKQVQKQLESGELDQHITADHRRYTKDNAGRLTEVIRQKEERLAALQKDAPAKKKTSVDDLGL